MSDTSGIERPERAAKIEVSSKFPKLIRVKAGKSLEIDGMEFPWYVAENGFNVRVGDRKSLTTVTITIPCDNVEIVEERGAGQEILDREEPEQPESE